MASGEQAALPEVASEKRKLRKGKKKSATEAAAAAAAAAAVATWNDLSPSARKMASLSDGDDVDEPNAVWNTVVEVHPDAKTTTPTTTRDAEIQTEDNQSRYPITGPKSRRSGRKQKSKILEEKQKTKGDSNWSRSSPSKGSG